MYYSMCQSNQVTSELKIYSALITIIIIIIIIVFNLLALFNKNKVDPMSAKKARSIQYGYRKRATHARMFSQTPRVLKSKNERRQRNRGRRVKMESKMVGTK